MQPVADGKKSKFMSKLEEAMKASEEARKKSEEERKRTKEIVIGYPLMVNRGSAIWIE